MGSTMPCAAACEVQPAKRTMLTASSVSCAQQLADVMLVRARAEGGFEKLARKAVLLESQ